MKITILLILLFSFTTDFMFSQTKNSAKVIGEKVLSKNSAEERNNLQKERNELKTQFSQLYAIIDKAKAKTPVFYENIEDVKVLENAIVVWSNVKVQLKNFTNSAQRLEQLDTYFNVPNSKRLEDLNGMISRAEQKQTLAENQIAVLNKTRSKEKKYDANIESLNAELEMASKEARNLEDVNTTYDVSFNDILAKRNSNKKSNNQLDDSFLNNENETKDGDLDFLTQEAVVQKNKTNFEISYKNGLQGVINPETNKVLIPFKDWRIEMFQDGIAKVSIDIDSEQVCSCRLGNYYASVKEVGYVDNNGEFIDGSRKIITGDFKSQAKLLIVKGNYDKEASDLRDKKEAQECIRQGKQWKIEAKRRYL